MTVNASDLAGRRVCLVTSSSVGSNPRLVKEADTLAAAGAKVRVVAIGWSGLAVVRERDAGIFARAAWKHELVTTGSVVSQRVRALLRHCARALWAAGVRGETITRTAYQPLIGALERLAKSQPAELFIAHNLAALPAAASAARRHGARLGFDAEDFHSGEFADPGGFEAALARHIEGRWLPQCDYVTAASDGIGKAYAGEYGLPPPTTILNVFPLGLAPLRTSASPERSLYWFSQTIGEGRGLEAVLHAIAKSSTRPKLYLQGTASPGYVKRLEQLAKSLGVSERLEYLAPAAPDDLPRIAASFHAGLATEIGDTPSRRVCLSNKIFTYLLGGIPVLATDTPGQLGLARQLPDAIKLLPLDNPDAWAARIDDLLLDPAGLAAARRAAGNAARERYNWDVEAPRFLQVVSDNLSRPPSAGGRR